MVKWNEEYRQTKMNKLHINFIGANVRSGENIRISPLTFIKVKPSKEIAIVTIFKFVIKFHPLTSLPSWHMNIINKS